MIYRVNKNNRKSAVLENAEEGEKYHQHAFRRFLATQRPEVFPALNRFFAGPATVARSDRHDWSIDDNEDEDDDLDHLRVG